MARIYKQIKDDYEKNGYLPFVCIITWPPESEAVAIERYLDVFKIPEGKGIKGLHTWNLIGRNTMLAIGWTNSPVSLQKFCTAVTYGTNICMDVCPAIDHDSLTHALTELKEQFRKTGGAAQAEKV